MRYRAVIQRDGKRWDLGTHSTRAEAQSAREKARAIFARTGDVPKAKKRILPPRELDEIPATADLFEAERIAHDDKLRTPSKELCASTFLRALEDLKPNTAREDRESALDWFIRNDKEPLSFVRICETLLSDFDVDAVRQKILDDAGIHLLPARLHVVPNRKASRA